MAIIKESRLIHSLITYTLLIDWWGRTYQNNLDKLIGTNSLWQVFLKDKKTVIEKKNTQTNLSSWEY